MLSEAQLRYLLALRDGRDPRVMTKRGKYQHTVAGFWCRKQGLAEFEAVRGPDGNVEWYTGRHLLTPAGRTALQEATDGE